MDLDRFPAFCHGSFVSSQHTCADRLRSLQRMLEKKKSSWRHSPHVQRVALTTRAFGGFNFFGGPASKLGRRCTSKQSRESSDKLALHMLDAHPQSFSSCE